MREFVTPTRHAALKWATSSHQVEGPHRRVGVHHHNSRRHKEVWVFITPTQGATPKSGSAAAQLKGPPSSMGVHHLIWRSHTQEWESSAGTSCSMLVC